MEVIRAFGRLVRTLLSLCVLVAIGYGGWVGYHGYYLPTLGLRAELKAKQAELDEITKTAAQQKLEIDRLSTAMRLLKVDHRVAKMAVLNQWYRPTDNRMMTSIGFGEVDDRGEMLNGYQTFEIEGNVVYVDAWVAKFMDEYVEQGVPLRSTTLCLFRRLFGENQTPAQGFQLDAHGSRPFVYSRGQEMSQVERDIWTNFWQLANNPAQAQQVGLRALHGEAPSIRLEPNKNYWLFLRASDGLTIKATDRPVAPLVTAPNTAVIQQAGYSQPAPR